jgi:hypothetical protein
MSCQPLLRGSATAALGLKELERSANVNEMTMNREKTARMVPEDWLSGAHIAVGTILEERETTLCHPAQ